MLLKPTMTNIKTESTDSGFVSVYLVHFDLHIKMWIFFKYETPSHFLLPLRLLLLAFQSEKIHIFYSFRPRFRPPEF